MNPNLLKAIKSSMQLQDAGNKVAAGQNWTEKGVEWTSCALTELGGALGWTPYKHLSRTGDCQQEWHPFFAIQAVVESYYLMLSAAIEKNLTAADLLEPADNLETYQKLINTVKSFQKESCIDSKRSLAHQGIKNLMKYCLIAEQEPSFLSRVVSEHLTAAASLGFNTTQFFEAHLPKNTLTLFRLANGDKQGTYPRMWQFEGDTIEDDRVVEIITERDHDLALDSNRLTEELGKILKSFVPIKAPKSVSPGM